jgi:uncharacterized protein (TIGR01777 family)
MKIVIAGSSGFLGTALRHVLAEGGHEVVRLVRRPPSAPDERRWDPYAGPLGHEVLEHADVVVCLSGSKLLGVPYSRRFRRTVHDSRVVPTRMLAEAIAASDTKPAFVAGNASAWYGDHGSEVVTEDSDSRGDAFMTRVARDWQAATDPAVEAGARVSLIRTVPVMARGSLTLNVLLPAFRFGLGARLGDGRHYFPVVSLRDWVSSAAFLVEHPTASGPFNVCCPEPPTNAEFTDAFAAALGRRARLVAPAPVMKLAAGPLAPETLGSFRLVPAALEASGHTFLDRDVHAVMRRAVAR